MRKRQALPQIPCSLKVEVLGETRKGSEAELGVRGQPRLLWSNEFRNAMPRRSRHGALVLWDKKECLHSYELLIILSSYTYFYIHRLLQV